MTLQLSPKILFEDTHLIVLDKPAGMLSQGGGQNISTNVVDWLREYLGRNYVGLVHRMDRNVSGTLLVAKRTKSAERLTRALQEGKIFRVYTAWVQGEVEAGRWSHYLVKDHERNTVRAFDEEQADSKIAVLNIQPLRSAGGNTLVEIRLETGRSHQIRVQCQKMGHPILGDPKYGVPFGDLRRPALHASEIEFPHPMSGERMVVRAPLPRELEGIS